jgi:hypothetical protein
VPLQCDGKGCFNPLDGVPIQHFVATQLDLQPLVSSNSGSNQGVGSKELRSELGYPKPPAVGSSLGGELTTTGVVKPLTSLDCELSCLN